MSVSLPIVLIGPILRRVEPRLVSVFIATREPARVHLSVYEGVVDASSAPVEFASGDADTMRFGLCFHAVVVMAAISDAGPLMPGHRYSYDLKLTTGDGVAHTLQSLLLLKDRTVLGYGPHVAEDEEPPDPPPGGWPPAYQPVEICSIGYAENQLPSFVTPPERLEDLNIAHASCRKPHGPGDPALQYLDEYLDGLDGAEAGWLHRVFLTGDQIYADDVAEALLPGLNSLAIDLISGAGVDPLPGGLQPLDVEAVPSPIGSGVLKANTSVLPAGFRQRATGMSGFTSESASSHLISFGEWLAMYCIAWNPDVWPVLAICDTNDPGMKASLKTQLLNDAMASPNDAPVAVSRPGPDAPEDVITPLFKGNDLAADALDGVRNGFVRRKQLMDAYRREVPKVRRMLANVPIYMIADDHEVTDDWFMTGRIRSACLGRPMGQAMIRNAMSAYTICQAWGNDPQAWSVAGDRRALLDAISGMYGAGWTGGLPVQAERDKVDDLLGLRPDATPKFDFSYKVDGPGHRIRVLDTRTRREYPTPYSPPKLMSVATLDQQLPAEDLPEGDVLIVISPVPVFGPAAMTELGGVLMATEYDKKMLARDESVRTLDQDVTGLNQGKPIGMETYDAEHWGADPAGLEMILQRLARYPRVVVLAGDVHYAGAFEMDWTDAPRSGDASRSSRIIHFTSSAAKNAWETVVRNLMMLNGMSVGLQRIGMPMTRMGWTEVTPPVVTNLGTEPPLARVRLQTAPVLLSDELFRTQHPLQRPPEWMWRASPIVDARAPADRPPAARAPALAAELPQGEAAFDSFAGLAAAHMQALNSASMSRGLQFLNNTGIIRFVRQPDGLHATQSLHSLRARPGANEKAAAYILHDSRLEPVPIAFPASVGPAAHA